MTLVKNEVKFPTIEGKLWELKECDVEWHKVYIHVYVTSAANMILGNQEGVV